MHDCKLDIRLDVADDEIDDVYEEIDSLRQDVIELKQALEASLKLTQLALSVIDARFEGIEGELHKHGESIKQLIWGNPATALSAFRGGT